jgi:hypothetical protein
MFSSISVVAKRVILFNREIISLLRLGVMVSDVANKHVSVKHTISDAAMRLQKAAKQAAIPIPASRMSRALFICLFVSFYEYRVGVLKCKYTEFDDS